MTRQFWPAGGIGWRDVRRTSRRIIIDSPDEVVASETALENPSSNCSNAVSFKALARLWEGPMKKQGYLGIDPTHLYFAEYTGTWKRLWCN